MHTMRDAQTVPKKVPSIVPVVLHFQVPFVGTYLVAKSLCSIGSRFP